MKPDTSRWRDQDQYEFYDALPVEGVAWECLSIGIETGPPIGSQKGPLPLVASGQRA